MRRRPDARRAWLFGFALLAARPAAAEVTVAVNDGRVDVAARGAPLSDVLERLARQTGMQVSYEGAPPRNLVTAAVQAATPAQAVLSVLEGLGVNYALQLDRTGREVRTLLLVTTRGNVPAAAPPLPLPRPRIPPPPPPQEDPDEPMAEEDDPVPHAVRPERFGERLRPGRERPERPGVFEPAGPTHGVFEPAAPAQATPAPGPVPTPAYPVSPFAPVAPPPQVVVPRPQPAPTPEPES